MGMGVGLLNWPVIGDARVARLQLHKEKRGLCATRTYLPTAMVEIPSVTPMDISM